MNVPYTVQLLRSSLPNIPLHGFTTQCMLASNPSLGASTLTSLFPGPETASTSAPHRLFQIWDESSLSSLLPSNEGDQGSQPRFHPVGSKEEKKKYNVVVEKLGERLRKSWEVRGVLVDGLSLLSRQPIAHLLPLSTTFHSYLTPLPLLKRNHDITSRILSHPSIDYPDSDSSSWYATRARLTMAYTLAELHVASNMEEYERSQDFLRTLAHGRETSVWTDGEKVREDAKDWIKWGGRGWLGTFRSWGL